MRRVHGLRRRRDVERRALLAAPAAHASLPGTLWLASREHVDSFRDLPPEAAAALGPVLAKFENPMLAGPEVARVHAYRWGDGGAHFHLWLMPRPLGMLEASGMMLPLWRRTPNVSDDECRAAAGAGRGPAGGLHGRRPAAPPARRLGTGDAVVVGLGAMLGAGVVVAFTPAAEGLGEGS